MLKIAIDGPAGSGKSTISKKIAEKYGLTYVDTGAFYRSAAWLLLKYNLTPQSLIDFLNNVEITIKDKKVFVKVNNNILDVTNEIRLPEVTAKTSEVSALPEIRKILTEKQKLLAKNSPVIMDGRDIATVVMPEAPIKIFLTASPEERAKRRYLEMLENGLAVEFPSVLEEIIKRDHADINRNSAPLKKAEDAIEIDTTGLTIDEVILKIEQIIKEKGF
ncbi:MAG: (d)CMP kinase [Calditerrivibrio sp.]|nr:(d)CMP kinase [Calditerrivibrio sp.]